jgi:hypothetical protein
LKCSSDPQFKTLWTYTKTYLIDHQWGDWYNEGLDKSPEYSCAQSSPGLNLPEIVVGGQLNGGIKYMKLFY